MRRIGLLEPAMAGFGRLSITVDDQPSLASGAIEIRPLLAHPKYPYPYIYWTRRRHLADRIVFVCGVIRWGANLGVGPSVLRFGRAQPPSRICGCGAAHFCAALVAAQSSSRFR